jgi:hypothetical protein
LGIQCFSEASPKKHNLALLGVGERLFPLSMIEVQLSKFKDIEKEQLLFDGGVVNFNDLERINSGQRLIRKIFNDFKRDENFIASDSVEEKRSITFNTISRYDSLLLVNVDYEDPFISIEFILYPVLKNPPLDTSSFWNYLDIQDKRVVYLEAKKDIAADSLEIAIIKKLKELFYQAHFVPRARISLEHRGLNGRYLRDSSDIISIVKGDTLYLSGYNSIIKEFRNDIEYRWKKIYPGSRNSNDLISLNSEGNPCRIIVKEYGAQNKIDTFLIELQVYDGVERTLIEKQSRDTVVVLAFPSLNIQVHPKLISSFVVETFKGGSDYYYYAGEILLSANTQKIRTTIESWDTKEKRLIEKTFAFTKDTILSGIDYLNRTETKKKIFEFESRYGIKNNSEVEINHKIYLPFYLGVYWFQDQFELGESYQLVEIPQTLNEIKIMLYGRLSSQIEMGIGVPIQQKTWNNSIGDQYRIVALPELELNWRFLQGKNTHFGLTGLGKFYQVEEPNSNYNQLIIGLKAQTGVTLLNGLLDLSLNFGLLYTTVDPKLINDFHQWLGLGIRAYFSK